MKVKKIGRLLILLTILLVVTTVPAWADGPDDEVIFGSNYTLSAGQTIGDLFVYGGEVTLEEDSQVDGDVMVFGGNLDAYGEIDGDVTVWGGNVHIHSTATVRGQVMAIGGNVTRDEGADVRGEEWEGLPFRAPTPPKVPVPPRVPEIQIQRNFDHPWLKQVGDIFRSAFGLIVMAVLGILVVVFIPKHTDNVAETMIKAPVQSLASGLVAAIAVPIVAAVLTITICLSPVAALLLLVAGIALLFGWIAAGLLLGVKVLRALSKTDPNHVAAVAVGVAILAFLSFIPCLGPVITVVVLTWGMGAVVYSFFGTRAYNEPPPKFGSSSKKEDYDPRMDTL